MVKAELTVDQSRYFQFLKGLNYHPLIFLGNSVKVGDRIRLKVIDPVTKTPIVVQKELVVFSKTRVEDDRQPTVITYIHFDLVNS